MSFGLKVFDAAGAVSLDTSHRLGRLVHQESLAANADGNYTLPAVVGAVVAFAVATAGDAVVLKRVAHKISVSGGVVSWVHSDATTVSQLLIFAYS